MPGDTTVAGGIHSALLFLADIAFRWIPATIEVANGAAPLGPTPVFTPITQPLSIFDFAHFLETTGAPGTFGTFETVWGIWVTLATIIILLCVAGIIYSLTRIGQLRRIEELRFQAAERPIASRDVSRTQLRWNRIMEEVRSDSEQNWRLAILEADILLNELLDVLGYKGETMGDKMKQVVRADFKTIDDAWEAHRVRNEIAHEGSLRQISHSDAEHVIGLYQRVFREFAFIE